jgi:anti-sigma B factor antagonist
VTSPWQATAWVEVSQEPGALILRLCGELDMASRDLIEPCFLAAIPVLYKVDVDLSALTFCDSSGIAMLLAAHNQARVQGTVLTLRNLQPSLARVFEASGVDHVLALA